MATDFYTHAFSDNFRLAKSKYLREPVDDIYSIIAIPKFVLVSDIWLLIDQAYVGGIPSLTIGWKGNGETADPEGFMSAVVADCTELGLKRAQHEALTTFDGKYFNGGSGAITVTVVNGSCTTAGRFFVFCQYSVIH